MLGIPTRGEQARKQLLNEATEGEGSATKADLIRVRRDIEKKIKEVQQPSRAENARRMVKMFAHGFANIGKSMNSPESPNRPRISQMPARRSSFGTSQSIGLDYLKHPALRGQTIKGLAGRARGVTFQDKVSAMEYANNLSNQGYQPVVTRVSNGWIVSRGQPQQKGAVGSLKEIED
jgi:hypothetical protein